MASERQIAANRRNAQKSTGPKTQAGRERSRMNALTHGLSRTLPAPEGPDPRVLPLARALAGDGVSDPGVLALAEQVAVESLTLVSIRLMCGTLVADAATGSLVVEPEAAAPDPVRELRHLERFERQALRRGSRALQRLEEVLAGLRAAHHEDSTADKRNRQNEPNLLPEWARKRDWWLP